MNIPVLTFFNNKGGVGKTSLVYHLAWMFAEIGLSVIAIDLDPQANLTASFFDEDTLLGIWPDKPSDTNAHTIYQCLRPLVRTGEILTPHTKEITPKLHVVPGDLALAGFEENLSEAWPNALGSNDLYRPFRLLTGFWQVAQMAAKAHRANIILADVGPSLGAINRSALIATDHVVIPLAADLFALQGLRNLGPTLTRWRSDWKKRRDNWSTKEFRLPGGKMHPAGYVLMQHAERLKRPVRAYSQWAERIPEEYQRVIGGDGGVDACLARLKHYRSLAPMAQEARKPIFKLTAADGAIGNHARAVTAAYDDFKRLAELLIDRLGLEVSDQRVDHQIIPASSA